MELILYKPSTPSPINFQDIVIRDFNYSDQDAGEGQITADYYLSDLVETEDWIGCYVSYKSETFTIREAPVRVKDNTTLMYKYTLRFSPYKALLKDWYFLDYVTEGSDVIYTGLAQTNFYGNIDEFAGRLISNLNKKEPSEWTVLNSASTEDKTRYYNFNFDSVYIWDALLDMQENLDIPFRVFGKTIEIGDVGTIIQHDGTDVNFRYGSTDKGLYSISRTPAPENRYNRIIPVGGDRNLPLNFYREELPSIALRTPYLMPKIFRSGDPLAVPPVAPGTKWWYDHPDKLTSEPVRELFMKFSDVYPTIEGTTYNSLPIDELYTVPPSYIDTIKEDGKPDEQTFNIGTTNMGFNIPSYISSTEEMKIEMKTGACAGCTFKIANVNGKSFNRYDYIHNLIARPTLVSEQGVAYPAGTIIKNPILAYDAYVAGDLKIAEVLYDPESRIINNDTFATITYSVTIYFENESVSRKELFSTFMVTVPPLTRVYLNEQYSSLLMVPANDSFYAESGLWNLYAEVEVTSTGKEDFGKSYIMGNFNFAENFIENVVVIKDPPTVVPPPGGNTILLQKDIETFGTLMPNTAQPLAVGDKFVITGIELPKTPYVDSAELKLETLGLAELEKAFTHKYSYSLGLDEKFLTLNNDIIPQLKIGNKILVDGNTEPLRITQCSVTYKEGRLLPEYTLAINNTTKPIQSAFKEINSKLAQIASNTRIVNEGSAVQVRTVESQIKKVEALAHDVYSSASSGQALSELGYIPENAANKTDIISQLSTVIQYPSAKAVYDRIQKLPHYSFGAVQFPSYIENPDGTFTVGAGKYCLSDNPDGTGFITCYDIPGATFTLTNQTQNYIVANYNNGSPTLQVITNVGLIDERMIVPVFSVYRNGTVLHTQWWDMIGAAAVNKLHQSVVKTQRYRRESGLALSEYGTNNLALSSGIIWVGLVPMNLSAINTATDNLSLWYHSGADWVNTIQPTYNNSQYDNGSGLVALTNNRYAVNWVFRGVESQKHLYIVLGRGDYSLSEAQGSSMPAIPTAISSHAVLVGRVIVQKGAATATSIQSAFDAQFSFAVPAAHNDLTGIQGGVAGDHQHFTTIEKTIATQSANASRAGYLLSTDWSTFNNKENAIAQGSAGQYWAWDKTWKTLNTAAVAESTNLYFTNARAVSAPLTGYVLGSNSALADTDTILTALGKVQGQINARALSSDLSNHTGNTTIHLTADEKAYLGKIMTYLKVAVDNTSMYSTINFYSESGVSAYGIGTGGGGGAGVDIIDNLLSVRADAALSANQGRILKGFVDLKQSQLNGLGFVKANGTSILYDNTSYATSASLLSHTGSTSNPHSVTAAQVGALALTGGTITGGYNALKIKRDSANPALISYENTVGVLGFIGVNTSSQPIFVTPDLVTTYNFWHSGNLLNIGTTASTARTALGLGSMATETASNYSQTSHNHSGVYHPLMSTIFSLQGSYVGVRTANRTASQYYEFWDSGAGWAKIYSGGFVNANSSDSYILLGGGGTKAISDFSLTSHNHNGTYALIAGSLSQSFSVNRLTTNEDIYINGSNLYFENNTNKTIRMRTASAWWYDLKTINNDFSITDADNYEFIKLFYNSGNKYTKIGNISIQGGALSGATTGSFSGNVSAASFTSGGNAVIHSGNIGSQSVNYANSAGQANKLRFLYPYGSTDVNTYLSGGGSLWHYGQGASFLNAPSWFQYGSIYQFNSYEDSLSLQIATTTIHDTTTPTYKIGWRMSNNLGWQNDWKEIIHSGNIGSQSVNYAASAGTSVLLDGYGIGAFLRKGNINTDYWNQGNTWVADWHGTLPDGLSGVYNYGTGIIVNGSTASLQLYAPEQSDGRSGDLWYRTGWQATKRAWVKVWHSGNLTNTISNGYLPYWNGSSLVNSTLWNSNSNIMVGVQRGDGAIGLVGQNYSMGYAFSTKFITLQSSSEQYGLTNDFGAGTSAQLSIVANQTYGNIGFYTGGDKGVANQRMHISKDGYVGIGYTDRSEKLAVNGSGYFNDDLKIGISKRIGWEYGDGNMYNWITNSYANDGGILYRSGSWTSGDASVIISHNFQTYFPGAWSTAFKIYQNQSAFFSKNVYIADGNLSLSRGSGVAYSTKISTEYNYPYIDTFIDSIAGSSYEGRISFRTSSGGGALSSKMIVANNGNVGIGYTGRSEKFAVAGSGYFENYVESSSYLRGYKVISRGNSGFQNDIWYANVANPIWSFGNATGYGLAYYQGSALAVGDAIGFHFGDRANPQFYVASGGGVWATTGTFSSTLSAGNTTSTTRHYFYANQSSYGVIHLVSATSETSIGYRKPSGSGGWTVGRGIGGSEYFGWWNDDANATRMYLSTTGALWTASYIESASYLKATSIKIGANWEAIPNGTDLELRYGGVMKAKLSASGDILAVGGVTAFAV